MKTKFIYSLIVLLTTVTIFIACNSGEESLTKNSSADKSELNLKTTQGEEKVVGKLENGEYIITEDISVIKEIFENQLRADSLSAILENFEIKKDTIEGTSNEYYYLIGSNEDENVKIATVVELSTSNFFIAILTSSNTYEKTCTCSGSCTKGCDPKRWQDEEGEINWRCSSCQLNGKTCNKSVTESSY